MRYYNCVAEVDVLKSVGCYRIRLCHKSDFHCNPVFHHTHFVLILLAVVVVVNTREMYSK